MTGDVARLESGEAVLRCPVCGVEVGSDAVWPWRCPNSSEHDRHHVLHRIAIEVVPALADDPHPFIRYDRLLTWARLAETQGLGVIERAALVREVDSAVSSVAGTGFATAPLERADDLSDQLGFSTAGGVWLQDLTGEPAGSAKARHLMSILLHLVSTQRLGLVPTTPELAIASCGNAALAASTLAAAMAWPIRVFVPVGADPVVVRRLGELGADVVVCPRRAEDGPGDPCIHRFHEAVAEGRVPFSVQGPENALCLDGGRTLAYEMVDGLGRRIDRVFAQVGGGALATSIGFGLADRGLHPRLHAVQTVGCAPLARAWDRWNERPGRPWSECMWPWESEPVSAASGILDDETYDWMGIVAAMRDGGGSPVVVGEDLIAEANALVSLHTSIEADHTGTAALAGLLALRRVVDPDEVVVVPITGVRRS